MAPVAMDIDNSSKLDAARALQAKLESAKLNIVEDQNRFDTLQSTLAKEPGLASGGAAGTTDPAIVAAEVASQIVRRGSHCFCSTADSRPTRLSSSLCHRPRHAAAV